MTDPYLTETIADSTRTFEHQSSGVLRHHHWHTELAEHLQAALEADGWRIIRKDKP